MRSLSDSEFAALTCGIGGKALRSTVYDLEQRGLVRTFTDDLDAFLVLPAGHLAVRLDLAARAIGGQRG